jgi:RecA/RadA recombinase
MVGEGWRLSTGIRGLDGEEGGLKPQSLYLIVGEEKSGRTTLALQIAAIASSRGVNVMWLDCGGRLHHARLLSIAKYWGGDLSRIRVAVPDTFAEQLRLLVWACEFTTAPGLIVVDDFTYLHRVDASGDPSRDKPIYTRLAFQAAYLKETTRTRDIAAIIIADVHERPGLGLQQPIAGAIVTFYSDLKLWMSTLGPGRKLPTVEGEVGGGRYILRVHEGGLSEL